ncbi:hypothetical protein SDC9_106340 [bioreactor metagenome]|uniref:Uncharacterized protein n=1 Tax=bioreactor metagenome TaxID=1076179 RepID=A0A645B342_9ZZZZ
MGRSHRNAHAARNRPPGVSHHVFARLQKSARPVQNGALGKNRRHKDQKHIPANSGGNLAVPIRSLHHACQLREHRVAENMAIPVVQAAKPVHVQHQHGGGFGFLHGGKADINSLPGHLLVEQPGQPVPLRQVRQLLRRLLFLLHVRNNADHPAGSSIASKLHRRLGPLPAIPPVGGNQAKFRLLPQGAVPDGLNHPQDIFYVQRINTGAALQRLLKIAPGLIAHLQLPVSRGQKTIRGDIPLKDNASLPLDGHLIPLQALTQILLHPLLGGDVRQHALKILLSVGLPAQNTVFQNPHRAPIGAVQAVFQM